MSLDSTRVDIRDKEFGTFEGYWQLCSFNEDRGCTYVIVKENNLVIGKGCDS